MKELLSDLEGDAESPVFVLGIVNSSVIDADWDLEMDCSSDKVNVRLDVRSAVVVNVSTKVRVCVSDPFEVVTVAV